MSVTSAEPDTGRPRLIGMTASRVTRVSVIAAAIVVAAGCGGGVTTTSPAGEVPPSVTATPSPRSIAPTGPAPRPSPGGHGGNGRVQQPTRPLPQRGHVAALAHALALPAPSNVYGPPWRIDAGTGTARLTVLADGSWTYRSTPCPPHNRSMAHSRVMCPMHIVAGPPPSDAQARRIAAPVLHAAGATGRVRLAHTGSGRAAAIQVTAGDTTVTVGPGATITGASGDLWT